MRETLRTIGQTLIRLLIWIGKKIRDNIVNVHLPRLINTENLLRLLAALLSLVLLVPSLIESNCWLGLSFLLAGLTALWRGWIYRNRFVIGMVVVGVILGSLVPGLAKDAWEALLSGDYVSVVVILIIGLLIYYLSSQLKKGRRP
jgi:hypothetical protein